jgi:hypothetical protein
MSYVLPQVKVYQEFRTLPSTVIENLNAFVFGPHFQLFRYSVSAEKALISLGAYDPATAQELAYPNKPSGSIIDTDYIKLYFESVWAEYADISTSLNVKAADELNKLTSSTLVFATNAGVSPSAVFKTRGVVVGDRLRYRIVDSVGGIHTGTTRVAGFEADTDAAAIGTVSAETTNTMPYTELTTAGTYTGASDTNYVAEVVRGGVFATGRSVTDAEAVPTDTITIVCTTGGILNGSTAEFSVTSAQEGALTAITPATGVAEAIGNHGLEVTFTSVSVNPTAGDRIVVLVTDDGTGVAEATVTITRAGLSDFTATADVTGWALATDATVAATVDFTDDWNLGDVDEIYSLLCTTGGNMGAARFSVTSDRGDTETGIQFTTATPKAVGSHGLVVTITYGAAAFVKGDIWSIVIRAKRARVKIYDSGGVDATSYVVPTENTNFDVGSYGVDVKFNTQGGTKYGPDNASGTALSGLVEGDIFYIPVTAEVETEIRTIVCADDLPEEGLSSESPQSVEVWFYLVQASTEIGSKMTQSPPDYNWEATVSEITVNPGIQVTDSSWTDFDGTLLDMNVYQANMYVEYRALLTTYADTIHSMENSADVEDTLGTIHPDNPLAQGVYNALLNSSNRAVYYMATPTNDLSGFNEVLDAASLNDDVYGLVPLSRNEAVHDAVIAHVNAMSTEESKQWRIAFVGSELPTTAAVYTRATNPLAVEYFAKIAVDPDVAGEYTFVTLTDADGDPSTETEALDDVSVGDKFRVKFSTDAWGDAAYEEYEVLEVLTNNTLMLESGPAAPISTATKIEIWHVNSTQEIADAVAAKSSGFANRRIYHVFPHELVDGNGVIQTAEFGAAAIGGLCSAVPPQQGLTNIAVNGFSELPAVYSTFNRTQLNKMAEYGTLIIMQRVAGGEVYVRHQVSTAASDGDLNTTELSVTKNLDSISYYMAGRLENYIGKYNITPELLTVLRTQITDGLLFLGAFTSIGLLGPQVVLGDGTSIQRLEQHPTLKDHVYIVLNLELPYPLNVAELHLVV